MAKGRLIFNADDFGLSPGVSRGILLAAEGVVRSTTILANLVRPDEALAAATCGLTPGAHLNLTAGQPLSRYYPGALLTPEGRFNKNIALNVAIWESRRHQDAVLAEWTAQIERLLALDVPLTHLDSHHHVHLFDPLFPIALKLAGRYRLALRTRQDQRTAARREGIHTPDALVEGFFGAGNVTRDHLLHQLAQVEGGVVEVMCHPGRVDPQLAARSNYVQERESELAVLADPALAEELKAVGWDTGGYKI